jgi:hypothetical protein
VPLKGISAAGVPTDIVLVNDNTADKRTIKQIYSQLDAFIDQDPYLSKHRGEVVERGAALAPYLNIFNLNFTQDFMVNVSGKKNTIRLTADVINFGNLLSRNWGLSQSTNTAQPLSYKGLETGTGKPTFSFPYQDNTNQVPYTSTFRTSTGGLWQAQLGIRYIFN